MSLNIEWDQNNDLLKGLDRVASSQEERQERAGSLGSRLWKAQHAGTVQPADKASFLVFIWNGKFDATSTDPNGFRVTSKREIQKYMAENVTGKVTATKLDGMGDPDRVYRISTDGVAASILLPWSAMTSKTFIIICREGKNGVYPNTISAKQGHAISPETLMWYKDLSDDDRFRTLIPFVSKRSS